MPTNKKKHINFNSVSVSIGCGSSTCRRPRLLTAFFHPKPRHSATHTHRHRRNNHSSTPTTTTTPTTTFSSILSTPTRNYSYSSDQDTSDIRSLKAVQGFGRIGGESVAVEKESEDPYLDFRHSMLQMILEKQIYEKQDLKELLDCFLQLNSPYYHGLIVRAFTEIWNGPYVCNGPSDNNNNNNYGVWEAREY